MLRSVGLDDHCTKIYKISWFRIILLVQKETRIFTCIFFGLNLIDGNKVLQGICLLIENLYAECRWKLTVKNIMLS